MIRRGQRNAVYFEDCRYPATLPLSINSDEIVQNRLNASWQGDSAAEA